MSSLNATQADGYYVPPEYFESGAYKKQSVSKFAGSKGHNQYLQRSVVRFELPFDGFCTHCSAHVGKGTRFNAHKAHVDVFFTTKIYEFTTKCRACAHAVFRIRTNPKDRTFDYTEGIRKKVRSSIRPRPVRWVSLIPMQVLESSHRAVLLATELPLPELPGLILILVMSTATYLDWSGQQLVNGRRSRNTVGSN